MGARVLLPELLHLVLFAILVQEVGRAVRANDAHVRTAARAQVVEDARVNRISRQLDGFGFLRITPRHDANLHIGLISVLQHRHSGVGARTKCIVGQGVNTTRDG